MADRKIGFYPLSKGIYDRIQAHALTSTYRIYNEVAPENPTFPYIVSGSPYGAPHSMSAADIPLEDNIIVLDFWSDLKTDKEVSQMMDNVSQALDLNNPDGTALTIAGYTQVDLMLDFAEVIRDDSEAGDVKIHGIMRVRAVMA